MKNALFVYSGTCRLGGLGTPTPLNCNIGNPLFVGDIVMTSSIDEFGICTNHGLSVVVSDKYTSYSNGEHKVTNENPEFFVMGIKNVDFMGADSEKWSVTKLKSFQDVIDGEHWTDYGFNYKSV